MHVTIELQFLTLAVHVSVFKVGPMFFSIYIHHRHQNGENHQYTVDKAIDVSFLLSSFAHLALRLSKSNGKYSSYITLIL